MSDMIKIRLYVGTGFVGCNHEDIWEVRRDWWEALSEDQKEKELDQMGMEFAFSYIDVGASVMEDD
jgi:hypothetical protein